MSTLELKYSLFKIIDSINDSKKLKSIFKLVSNSVETNFWDKLTREEKAEIETAIAELDAGKGISHEKVMSKYKGKYI